MNLVSIIVPVYNVENFLQRSIDSIINQTYSNWELILINDGSTDFSLEICKKNQEKDSRIKVFTQKNQGVASARNKGLDYCKGEFVSFVDPDDYLDSNCLMENVKIMREYTPDLIVNGYREISANRSNKVITTEKKPSLIGLLGMREFREKFEEFEKISPRPIWNKMYNINLIKKYKIKFPDQRVGEDAIFNNEIYRILNSVLVNDKIYYNYDRTREGSLVKTYNEDRFYYDFNVVKSYKKVFSYWNVNKSLEMSLTDRYIDCLMNEVVNINLPDSPYSIKERNQRLKDLISIPEIKESIENVKIYEVINVRRQIFIALLKIKQINIINFIFRKIRKNRMK